MASPLTSVRNTWADVTDYRSTRTKAVVVLTSAALGWVVSLELTGMWTHTFGYSSVFAVFVTILIFHLFYFCGSYVVTRTAR